MIGLDATTTAVAEANLENLNEENRILELITEGIHHFPFPQRYWYNICTEEQRRAFKLSNQFLSIQKRNQKN